MLLVSELLILVGCLCLVIAPMTLVMIRMWEKVNGVSGDSDGVWCYDSVHLRRGRR